MTEPFWNLLRTFSLISTKMRIFFTRVWRSNFYVSIRIFSLGRAKFDQFFVFHLLRDIYVCVPWSKTRHMLSCCLPATGTCIGFKYEAHKCSKICPINLYLFVSTYSSCLIIISIIKIAQPFLFTNINKALVYSLSSPLRWSRLYLRKVLALFRDSKLSSLKIKFR